MKGDILIGIDLDGTLLTPDKKITKRTQEVLKEAIRSGIKIVPATGRPVFGLPDELLKISGIDYVIANNGAVIYGVSDRKIIHTEHMMKEKCVEIYDKISSYASVFEVFMGGYGYETQCSYDNLVERFKNNIILDYIRKSRKHVPDLRKCMIETNSFIDGISIMCNKTIECSHIKKLLDNMDDINVIEASENELEIYSWKAGKGNALTKLSERLGIPREAVVAIGDGNNDIDMFQKSGFSIAMENSTNELKEVASVITLSNSQDGVALAIKKYFL